VGPLPGGPTHRQNGEEDSGADAGERRSRLQRRDPGAARPVDRGPDGQIVALLGANGAGKTTTLRAISGLLDVHDGVVTKGSIVYNGIELKDKKPSRSSTSASPR
jgi:ABC-type transport system involved in cytochrome bd biosynthesis fused ATPase/permease subunit